MIKNIVFDIGNVILKGSVKDVVDQDTELNEEDKQFIKDVVFEGCTICDYKPFTYKEYYKLIDHKVPLDLKEKAKYYLFNSYKLRTINKDIVKLMKVLKKHNYNIYILSDNTLEVTNYLKITEIGEYVDGWCMSYMYNESKANTNLYDIFFDEFDLDPDECYFIDDKDFNISNALKHGMRGYAIDWKEHDFEDLVNDMKRKNIVS